MMQHCCTSTSASTSRWSAAHTWQGAGIAARSTRRWSAAGHGLQQQRRAAGPALPVLHALPRDEERTTKTTNAAGSQTAISLETGLPALELQHRVELCDSGLPDVEECLIPAEPPKTDVLTEALSRGKWLLGLLIIQSTSSFVLNQYEDLLRDHIVVTLFLTMLVGAGGNAGNQSAIKVIRALATGNADVSGASFRSMMGDQAQVAMLLGGGLSVGGFIRVYATNGNLSNAIAISSSLFMIVMTSVVLGTGLPFLLARVGVDPANAGTSIQVVMDILGVAITCVTCHLVLVQFASSFA